MDEQQKIIHQDRMAILRWLATFAVFAAVVILLFGTLARPR